MFKLAKRCPIQLKDVEIKDEEAEMIFENRK